MERKISAKPMDDGPHSIDTLFTPTFHNLSAYEFSTFRNEAPVRNYWRETSIYMICQHPILMFSDVTVRSDASISGRVSQRGHDVAVDFHILSSYPPHADLTDTRDVEMCFLTREPSKGPIFQNVAAFKFFNDEGKFLAYLSPEKLIYESFRDPRIGLRVTGNIAALQAYEVLYVGQAQDQAIEERLARHESLQTILSETLPMIERDVPAMEVTLLLFGIDQALVDYTVWETSEGDTVKHNGKVYTGAELDALFALNAVEAHRTQIINDAEAWLIQFLQPRYNKIRYNNYPDIANGLRSVGFDAVTHSFFNPYTTLRTEEATIQCNVGPIFANEPLGGRP